MKTIKTIAAVVLAMFVGNANAALVITDQDIEDHMETMEVYYQAEDIDCEIWSKMFTKGVIEGNDKFRHGIRVHKDLTIVAMKAKSEFYNKYAGEVVKSGASKGYSKERVDQIRDVYIGAYIGAAEMKSRVNSKFGKAADLNSVAKKRAEADHWFNFCVKVKEEYPVVLFNEWLAIAQLAEDDF
ncbi:hypothetical protein [Escherichia coli]|uniref:hypothetical protein n=1 Tax=Escherichia coli TaxID=562 RepID=UPI0005431423|nr:hypothetical protein [Escherichia coli]KHI93874.1 hypothetical protein PU12_19025 [Escherichia coli]